MHAPLLLVLDLAAATAFVYLEFIRCPRGAMPFFLSRLGSSWAAGAWHRDYVERSEGATDGRRLFLYDGASVCVFLLTYLRSFCCLGGLGGGGVPYAWNAGSVARRLVL